jgi:hypothetical protein
MSTGGGVVGGPGTLVGGSAASSGGIGFRPGTGTSASGADGSGVMAWESGSDPRDFSDISSINAQPASETSQQIARNLLRTVIMLVFPPIPHRRG